jgi:hypothetical protein
MHVPGRRSARWRAGCVAVASMLVAACTTVVDGVAAKAPGGPPPGAVDVALLDTGNYPTRPQPPLGKAGTRFRGGVIEAARMAGSVVGPWEIDSRLTDPGLAADIIEDADGIPLVESPTSTHTYTRSTTGTVRCIFNVSRSTRSPPRGSSPTPAWTCGRPPRQAPIRPATRRAGPACRAVRRRDPGRRRQAGRWCGWHAREPLPRSPPSGRQTQLCLLRTGRPLRDRSPRWTPQWTAARRPTAGCRPVRHADGHMIGQQPRVASRILHI